MQQNIWNIIEQAFVPHEFAPYPESDANLLAASCLGSMKDIQEYISQGADVNVKNFQRQTALSLIVSEEG